MIARLVSLTCVLLSSGCALFPGDRSPTAAPGGPSPMRAGLQEYRATIHCHCYLSHDSEGQPETIADAAREQGLQVVLLTDHYEPGNVGRSPRGLVDGVLFVPGVEVRLPETGGSILALGLRDEIEGVPRERLVETLNAQGAFVIAGHVEGIPEGYDLGAFQGFEVFNLHAQMEQLGRLSVLGRALVQTRDRLLAGSLTPMDANRGRWDRELADGRRLVPVAGHDAHDNVQALGVTFGTYAELFRLFSTRILAPELTELAVLDALRAGHVYVGFDHLGDAGGFSSRVVRPDGDVAIVGETTVWSAGSELEVRLPARGTIRVFRDGRPWLEREDSSLEAPLPGGGLYRVEAWRDGRLWIVASPIDVLDQS